MAAIDIGDKDFQEKVLDSKLPVLVDFWASWCGPCKMAAPVIEELSKKYEGKVSVVKVNVDENQESPQKYGVLSIPTTVLFVNGKEVGRQVGFAGEKPFEDLIKKGM